MIRDDRSTRLPITAYETPAAVAGARASRVYPLDDGCWRVVWRGQPICRSFVSRGRALAHLEACDRAEEPLA